MSETDGSNLDSREVSSSDNNDFTDTAETQYSFTASTVTAVDAAGIRVLVVAIGPVRQHKLVEWSSGIAQFSQVELSDLLTHVDAELVAAGYSSSSGGGGSGFGAAEGSIEGALQLVYTTDINEDHEYLEGLQTYRQILGVIGIIDCKMSSDVSEAYSEFLSVLAEFPTAVGYRCLAFDPLASQDDDVAGVTVIPNYGEGERSKLLFYLQTLVSDFAGTMVSALSMMAKSIEDRADLVATPVVASPVRRSHSAASSSDPNEAAGDVQKQRHHSSNRSSVHEATEIAASAMAHRASMAGSAEQRVQSPPAVRRESTHSLPSGRGRRGGELDRDAVSSGSPVSAVFERRGQKSGGGGDAAGAGRLKKLQGDLFLMSGRLGEAFSAYAASIESSRAVGDHLWHAVALEGYCTALLLQCSRTSERRLAVAYMAAIADGSADSATGSEAGGLSPQSSDLGSVLRQLGRLFAQVPVLYERCYTFAPLLHSEACVRAALVLHGTREALLHDAEAAVHALVRMRQAPRVLPPGTVVSDVVAGVRNVPLRAAISEWLQRGWSSGSAESLALADQLEMTTEISAVFRSIGYSRKSFFFLRQFLLLAIPVLLRTATAAGVSPGGRPSMSTRATDHTALSAFADGSSAFAAVSSAAAAAAAAASGAGMSAAHARGSFGSEAGAGDAAPGVILAREWISRPRAGLRAAVVACLDALVCSFGLGLAEATGGGGGGGGWMQLQADVLRECLAIAEALPSYAHALAAAFRLVRCLALLADAVAGEPQRRALVDEQLMLRAYLVRTIGLFHQQRRQLPADKDGPDGGSIADGAVEDCRVAGRDCAVLGGVLDTLLVGVQFCMHAEGLSPIATAATGEAATAAAASDTLFLHNPSAQSQTQEAPVLVAGEEAFFVVTLANPFPFALPLSAVSLVAEISGDENSDHSHASVSAPAVPLVVLPAGARAQVGVSLTPRVTGQLRVCGVRLAVFQHLQVACLLATEDAAGLQRRVRELPMRRRLSAERRRLLGLASETTALPGAGRLSAMNPGYAINARVVRALPRLAVSESSLACEESLSVYEGEFRVLVLTLVNCSRSAAVGRLDVTFAPLGAPPTTAAAGAAGSSHQAGWRADEPRADARARDLVNAAFSYLPPASTEPFTVAPGDRLVLRIRVCGLAGLTGAEVVVRYQGADNAGGQASAWARELRWPLRVSVVRLVAPAHDAATGAAVGSDLGTRFTDLPTYIARAVAAAAPPDSDAPAIAESSRDLAAILRDAYAEHCDKLNSETDAELPHELFCLAEINLVNLGSTDVKLCVQVNLATAPRDETCETSPFVRTFSVNLPGRRSFTRVVVPLPRVHLSHERLQTPVPGIEADGAPDRTVFYAWHQGLQPSKEIQEPWRSAADLDGEPSACGARAPRRQFVVSRTAGMGPRDLARFRETHWYQSEVAARVRMRWTCARSGRHGFVDPRPLLTIGGRALSVVRPRALGLRLCVGGCSPTRVGAAVVRAKCGVMEDPGEVTLTLVNRLLRPVDLVLAAFAGDPEDLPLAASVPRTASLVAKRKSGGGTQSELAYLPYAAAARTAEASSGDLVFTHSTVPAREKPQKDEQALLSDSAAVPSAEQLACLDDLVFDNISALPLPQIAAGAKHEISLPLCILSPGIYRLHFTITEHAQTEHSEESSATVVQETLMIEAT